MAKNPALQDPGPAVAAGIELLIRNGFAATSVDELADAAGMSRSTFFRRFGSKEDMVFADHERLLARVGDHLSAPAGDPLTAVTAAALLVFEQHVRHRDTSLLRSQLLRQVPALRDRELVTTHRYERAFRNYLITALPDSERRDYGASAFAAAVVAVHNRVLREWQREVAGDPDAGLDRRLTALLGRELGALVGIFRSALVPTAERRTTPEVGRPAVVVTVLDPGAGEAQILDAVRAALGT
jgi:AcrR family transcriptional regulator